jgi:L-amino acid N-acyltransferase YncA
VSLTYQQEDWATYHADTSEIWQAHYDEIAGDKARMAMKPDVKMYQTLESANMLQIVTVRDEGRLVGYMLFTVHPHGHYADTLCGFEDSYYLLKSHRKGWTGIKLIRESIAMLKHRGVQRAFIHTKKSFDKGRVLEFLGFTHSDEIYSAWIGD